MDFGNRGPEEIESARNQNLVGPTIQSIFSPRYFALLVARKNYVAQREGQKFYVPITRMLGQSVGSWGRRKGVYTRV